MKSIVERILLVLALAYIPKVTVEVQEKQRDPVEASPVGEITETAGTRFIGGVYPHLTTYTQNRVGCSSRLVYGMATYSRDR